MNTDGVWDHSSGTGRDVTGRLVPCATPSCRSLNACWGLAHRDLPHSLPGRLDQAHPPGEERHAGVVELGPLTALGVAGHVR